MKTIIFLLSLSLIITEQAYSQTPISTSRLTITSAPSNDDALTQVLVRDGSTGIIKYKTASTFSGSGAITSSGFTMSTSRLLGRTTASTGAIEEISVSSPLTFSSLALGIQNAAADGSTKGAASFTANDFDASSGNISIDYTNGQAASGSNKGFLTSADWTTFNNKGSVSSVGLATGTTGTDVGVSGSPITGSGTITLNIPTASASNRGALSSTDWSTFNNKIGGSGTSGRVAFWDGSASITSSVNFTYSSANNELIAGGVELDDNIVHSTTLHLNSTSGAPQVVYSDDLHEFTAGARFGAGSLPSGTGNTSFLTVDPVSLEVEATTFSFLKGTASLDFPNTVGGTQSSLTITVTGAAVGDPVTVARPDIGSITLVINAFVTAADTVTIYYHNYGAGAINEGAVTYNVIVFKY